MWIIITILLVISLVGLYYYSNIQCQIEGFVNAPGEELEVEIDVVSSEEAKTPNPFVIPTSQSITGTNPVVNRVFDQVIPAESNINIDLTKFLGKMTPQEEQTCPSCPMMPDLSNYVLKSQIPSCPAMPDLSNYVLKTEIPSCPTLPNLSNYVLKTEIPSCPKLPDLENYVLKSEIPPTLTAEQYRRLIENQQELMKLLKQVESPIDYQNIAPKVNDRQMKLIEEIQELNKYKSPIPMIDKDALDDRYLREYNRI
jgi:hypothetical protein